MSDSTIRTFDIIDLTEGELAFLTNATFNVTINSKDAKLVVDLQLKLMNILQGAETENAVAVD